MIRGRWCYGTATEVHSVYDRTVSWARKTRSYLSTESPRQTSMCAEFLLLRKAREEHAVNILHAQEPTHNWGPKDLPHVDSVLSQINFDMLLSSCGDRRNSIKENTVIVLSEMFVLRVCCQIISRVEWVHYQTLLREDIKIDRLFVFYGESRHIKFGDLAHASSSGVREG